MAWPKKVYAATKSLGVYRTLDFGGPTDPMPTWTAINDGLANTNLISFCLDMNASPVDSRMFSIDGTDYTLWRRTTGNWMAVLTTAQARTIALAVGTAILRSVIVDQVTGYVYALLAGGNDEIIACMRSIDHGDNWTAARVRDQAYLRSIGNIDAHGHLTVLGRVGSIALGLTVYYAVDDGQTFHSFKVNGISAIPAWVRINRADPSRWTGTTFGSIEGGFGGYEYYPYEANTGETYRFLQLGLIYGANSPGGFWGDPADEDHAAILSSKGSRLYTTHDDWGTIYSEHALPKPATEIADNCEDGFWVLGLPGSLSGQDDIAPVYVTPDAVTLTNRSGTNWKTDPYTDAIPVTCGGILGRGLWAVPAIATPWALYDCTFMDVG